MTLRLSPARLWCFSLWCLEGFFTHFPRLWTLPFLHGLALGGLPAPEKNSLPGEAGVGAGNGAGPWQAASLSQATARESSGKPPPTRAS
jgi:hypothetical protein